MVQICIPSNFTSNVPLSQLVHNGDHNGLVRTLLTLGTHA